MTDAAAPVRELSVLVVRARRLADRPRKAGDARRLLGITGPPGAGKSRLAERLVAELPQAALVGMDGFHIGDDELRRLGLRDRKGAPETFDRAGFGCLLRRLRIERAGVYVPVFDRTREDSIAAAAAVPATAELVVIEGNYLLHWPEVRDLLDEVWYLDPAPAQRRAALIARHVAHGKAADEAERWVDGSDERNARLVAMDRERADEILGWGGW